MGRPQILSLPERLDVDHALTGRGVVIGFVDVGFYAHPDLFHPTKRMRAYVDVTRDRPDPAELFAPRGSSWHGTMAACAAAGSGYVSGGRYRGVASDAEVVLLKVGDADGRFRGASVADAIRFPLRHPELRIRILSISLGVEDDDPAREDVEKAVDEATLAGITLFAAAGNTPGVLPEVPGACGAAITVGGAHDRNTRDTDDDLPWPSSHGITKKGVHKPDLVAPAALLPAPMLPGTLVAREAMPLFQLLSVLEELGAEEQLYRQSGKALDGPAKTARAALFEAVSRRIEQQKYIGPDYQHVDGTSFAAPIAASVAAQMLEANGTLSPADLRTGLISTAHRIPKASREIQGAGVIRPRAAVEWARKRKLPDIR
jgi:serine protease AprX